MKYDFLAIGGATEDITFYICEGENFERGKGGLKKEYLGFELGAKIKVEKAYSSFGGGAANAAVTFSNLGFKTAVLVCLGRDERGDRIVKNFRRRKVKTSLIQKTRKIETSFSFIIINPEKIAFSNRAANDELSVGRREMKKIGKTKWVYLASLSGDWKDALKNVFSVAGPKFAWNPGMNQLKSGSSGIGKYLAKTDVLIMNKEEAIEFLVSSGDRPKTGEVKELLLKLKSWKPGIALLTDGAKGAYAYDGKNFYFRRVTKEKKKVDTTGVGDCFGSSFVAGLEFYGGDIRKSLDLASANAASVIAKQGAQNGLLKRSDLTF